MSLPPAAVLPLLTRWPDERVLGTLLTGGVHRFLPTRLGQPGATAAIWAMATQRRFWLVAHDPATEETWAVAVADPALVRVGEGWQRDTLQVGPWTLDLRRGSRREAQALRARFEAASPDGEPWPPPAAPPGPRTPPARGADLREDRRPEVALVNADERVLCALETDQRLAVSGWAGPADLPLWLWISTHRVLLAAAHPDGGPSWTRPLPPGPLAIEARALAVDDLRLLPRGPREQIELAVALAAVSDPADRWALAARHALIHGAPARAVRLLGDAWANHGIEASWPHIAEIALACGQGRLATAAAARALASRPELDVAAVVALWEREVVQVARAVRAARLSWRAVREVLHDALDAAATGPAPPEALAEPARRPREVWAAALAAHRRFADARAVWGPPGDAREHTAVAALAELQGSDDAAAAWQRAAERARAEGLDPYPALACATGQEETAARRWRWGAWAWQDGRTAEAAASWRRALALDDGAGAAAEALPAAARRALADVALAARRPAVAIDALRASIAEEPHDEPTRLRLALLLADEGRRPVEAARVHLDLVADHDAGRLKEPAWARHAHLVAAARLFSRGGDPDRALAALHEAVAGSYLDLDAWDAVLDVSDVSDVFVPAPVRGWWAHLRGVLTGTPAGEPLPPAAHLDGATLDALHPGGVGWLAGLRQALASSSCPEARALTRGLDRVADDGHAEAQRLLDHLARTLDLPIPPSGWTFRGTGAWGVSAWPSAPPVVLVGARHLRPDDERALTPAELRFALAAELVHLRCDHPVLTFEQSWLDTSRSVYDQVDGWAGAAEVLFDLATLLPGVDQARKVGTLVKLGRAALKARGAAKGAARLADPIAGWIGGERPSEPRGLSRERLSEAALRMRMQAERAALLLTGDLAAAVAATLKLSTAGAAAVPRVATVGLLEVLRDPDGPLSPSEAIRLTGLVAFAAAHRPMPERVAPLAATRPTGRDTRRP
jgi:tetratricopeptide (TPR) repeat protein